MHIAIDARELTGKPTGVGTYLSSLLGEWAKMAAALAHRWTLYVPEGTLVRRLVRRSAERAGGRREAPQITGLNDSVFMWRPVPGRAGTWWEQGALAAAIRRDRPDVLFAPGYTAPLAITTPVVLTVHDLSFAAHPEWFSWREGLRRRVVTRWAAKRARTILTVSEFSRNEIVARFSIAPERVRAIRHGITRRVSPLPAESRPPVVLYVGSIFNRRRVPDLMRAFSRVVDLVPRARLEIVGENRTHPAEDLEGLARRLNIANQVRFRSYVSDEELTALYASARAFAFLSEYEGFGFTPLEALAHSVPVVVVDTPVAREIYQESALYVPAGDIGAICHALTRLLGDELLRRSQLAHGQRVLAGYCWPESARLTLAAIEEAGRRG